MRALLDEAGVRLSRFMGQNFMHDRHQLERMVAAAGLRPTDSVLEIGPGLGPLTEPLLDAVPQGRVLAVEKDARLAGLLVARLGARPNLEVRVMDALEWLRREPADRGEWRVVSNLPYSVASPILVELAQSANPPARLVVTLQWEVLERVLAVPECRDYGVLTLLLQLRYHPGPRFRIPPTCFFPEPAVDSGCVRLDRRDPPLLGSDREVQAFEKLVRRGFSQRRKMIPKLLRQDWPEPRLSEAMELAGISPQARAEHVSLDQYAKLAITLAAGGSDRLARPKEG
jgi:16S rRNA (adenine1518-N6/adenine1519-N6)-dimethyltransferase